MYITTKYLSALKRYKCHGECRLPSAKSRCREPRAKRRMQQMYGQWTHTQSYLPCEHCMQMCISAVCPTVSLSARVYLPELRLFIVLVYVPSS